MRGYWLLQDQVLATLESARDVRPTAAQLEKFEAARRRGQSRRAGELPQNMSIDGSTATIQVQGVLGEGLNFWVWLMGLEQTTYGDVRESISVALADPAIRNVVLAVDSPGGEVDGLFETLASIEQLRSTKATSVRARSAHSAAYALAAAAGLIQAAGAASSFGSVGVAVSFHVDPQVVDITSSNAPNKRPDVTTPEGKAVVQGELDAYHELFVDAIARGRRTTPANINANYGRGGSVLAGRAKDLGMIDSVGSISGTTTKMAALSGGKRTTMTSEELKAAYPATFSAIHALGVAQERDRIRAHLKFGEQSGDMKTALTAVKDGSELTMELMATYLTSSKSRIETAAWQADSDAAGKVLDGAAPATEAGRDLGDEVADRIERHMGKKPQTVTA
jgi:ClpP class serine protease